MLDLYEDDWKIFTRSEEMPPVKVGEHANIVPIHLFQMVVSLKVQSLTVS